MSTVTEDQVASDRDLYAARLSSAGWTYARISEYLRYPDRRAAHRGVLRGLAEPAAAAAMLRSARLYETDEQLRDLHCRLWDLKERHRPHPESTAADLRRYFRIIDALLRVLDTGCRLHGLYTQPWRYDRWWRRDVPAVVWVPLQRRADQLGREARIPLRWRSPAGTGREPAPVAPLPVPVALGDVDSLVSPSMRRLLEAG